MGSMRYSSYWPLAVAGLFSCFITRSALALEPVSPVQNWAEVVRSKPYADSKGVYDNVMNVRRWILTRSGHCTERNRHLLFDMRGNFLQFIDDATDTIQTQLMLNQTRQGMAQQGLVHAWVAGNSQTLGYPFAIRCHQPYVDLPLAISRYLGELPDGRLSGNWDGIKVGTPNNQASLHDTLRLVHSRRLTQKRISLPDDLLSDLAGMLIIESGGVREAHSKANARGILQLTPQALKDCKVPNNKQLHRIAQVDCALWLFERNHRMLKPVFLTRFGHLPQEKQDQIYRLLLIQAYHGGPGRVRMLLTDDEFSKPAAYFAKHHQDFSAGDIAFGMVFHNLGRNRLGFASLYYTADIRIALQQLEFKQSTLLALGRQAKPLASQKAQQLSSKL